MKQYRLIKDTIEQKAGTIYEQTLHDEKYIPKECILQNVKTFPITLYATKYSADQVENNPEWFELVEDKPLNKESGGLYPSDTQRIFDLEKRVDKLEGKE